MNVEDRNPWLAGILTFFAMGLGHLYAGQAKRGLLRFYLGQWILLAIILSAICFFPTPMVLVMAVSAGIGFIVYAIVDAVKLAKRKKYGYRLKRYNKWYLYLGYWIVASLILQPVVTSSIKALFIQAYKIPAGSLKPTLLVGDFILAKKGLTVKQGIERGDVIIFAYPKDPSKDYIKRVIALGGETIQIVDKRVLINGASLQEPYVIHIDPRIINISTITRDNFGPVTVPPSALFVMGDNRDASNDSRFWGFLEKAAVKGKAYSIYWSWDRKRSRVRWDRIGNKIE